MSVQIYETFAALPRASCDFAIAAARNDFFVGLPWIQALTRTTSAPGDGLRIYVSEINGQPGAILIGRERRSAGRLRSRMLLGPSHGMYTTVFGPLIDGPNGGKALTEIAHEIAHTSPPFDVLRFDSVDPDAPSTAALIAAFRAAGLLVQPFFNFPNWCEDVEGLTIDSFLARRSKQTRYFIGRHVRRMERSRRGRFELVTGGTRLGPALLVYAKVDRRSWKKPEPYPDCISEVAHAAATEGVLRLGLYYVDDEPAAAQIWIVSGGRATIMRLHYVDKFAKLSVGTVLTFEMLRHALEVDHIRELDFGRGDDDYKKKWVSQCRPRYGILAFNRRTRKGAALAMWHFGGHLAALVLQKLRLRPEFNGDSPNLTGEAYPRERQA